MLDLSLNEYKLLKDYLYQTSGIDIPEEKSYLFRTRLYDIIEEEQFKSFNELYNTLKSEQDSRLENRIIEVMTTHETSFFRDTHPFQTFKQILLPDIAKRHMQGSTLLPPVLSVWSAGCSTGQEPYSIAMIIKDFQENMPDFHYKKIRILATDISNEVLEKGKKGIYSQKEVDRGLTDYYREKYFKKKNGRWVIDDSIRKMITFNEINLSKGFFNIIGTFDFIFCRNVTIYFSADLKKRLIDYYFNILNPGGILIIGASENLYKITEKFITEYSGPTTYYRVKK